MNLDGARVLITGAAGGIGRATALAFGAAGAAAVAIVDVDAAGAAATVELAVARGTRAIHLHADVGDPDSLAAAFAEASESFGGLDVVHNNAGLPSGMPDWPDADPARLARIVAINLGGVIVGTQLALRSFGAIGGVVINTASVAGLRILPPDPAYAATKAGVLHFTASAAPLAAERGVRINAVVPGMVETPFLARTGEGEPAPWLSPALASRELLTPEHVAAAVLDLAADDAAVGECRVVEPARA